MPQCNSTSLEAKPELKAVPAHSGFPQFPLVTRSVADQIAAFLDGRTHGEELLHELYDHVLEEPIPQSMQALLKQSGQTDPIS